MASTDDSELVKTQKQQGKMSLLIARAQWFWTFSRPHDISLHAKYNIHASYNKHRTSLAYNINVWKCET